MPNINYLMLSRETNHMVSTSNGMKILTTETTEQNKAHLSIQSDEDHENNRQTKSMVH